MAWVTVDDGDDDAVVLWSHVIEALCRACPGLDHETLAALAAAAPLLEVVLPRLVNALAEQPEAVLVLDDFHRLSSPSTRSSVAWFVEHLPSTVQLVLSSRTDPALPLGTLRARGQLLELRADELRFTAAEADEFLNGRLGLELDPADVELLVARTEGWPAGLYLAALSLSGSADKHALVMAFDGTSAHVVDFLAGEVLAAHEPDLQAFMLRTSVLERLCAPLCDAVLERSDAAEALASLARSNLFLLALDDRRQWFRFHHLFAQILHVELERREPAIVPDLHRRAFAWHSRFGTTDEAIHHALAADAYAEAGELIAETWVHYANAGRTTSVLDWLGRFPDAILDADPQLLVVKAWVAALRAREDEMRAAMARARELGGLATGPLPDGFASLESSLSVLSATFGWGDVSAILEHGAALCAARRGRLAVAAGDHLGARLGSLLQRRPGRGRALADRDDGARPTRRPMDRRRRRDRRPLAHRGPPRAGGPSRCAWRRRLSRSRASGACWTPSRTARCTRPTASRCSPTGRPEEALVALEKGVFLRRLWGQPLDLIDGLIELAAGRRGGGRPAPRGGPARRGRSSWRRTAATRGRSRSVSPRPGAPRGSAGPPRDAAGAQLSERERTVLRLLATGLSEREIGDELYLSFNTVHTHVKAIYRKLGVSSRADAVSSADGRAAALIT